MTRRNADNHPLGCVCKVCVGFKRSLVDAHSPWKFHGRSGAKDAALAPRFAPKGRVYPTPTVGNESSPPLSNTGVTEFPALRSVSLVMTDSGQIKQTLVRIPAEGQCSVIDWVNFTVHESTWSKTAGLTLISDEQYIAEASRHLEKIFGFPVTSHIGKGKNFYLDSWVLGQNWGFVCFGSQRQTMLIMLNGQGCLNAKKGWEKRLYDFLTIKAVYPKLTRVDLAHDDFTGEHISVDWADQQWDMGGFTITGDGPTLQHLGAWRRPSGKGRTLTAGLRESGKYCRFYEKGKKDGDKDSLWCRAEVEFKSTDRILPFTILLSPSDYFVAAYPCFSIFSSSTNPARIETKKKTAKITYQKALETTRHQFGKYIRVFRGVVGDDAALLDMLQHPDENAWPQRLLIISANLDTCPAPLYYPSENVKHSKFTCSDRFCPVCDEIPLPAYRSVISEILPMLWTRGNYGTQSNNNEV